MAVKCQQKDLAALAGMWQSQGMVRALLVFAVFLLPGAAAAAFGWVATGSLIVSTCAAVLAQSLVFALFMDADR